MRCDRRLLLKIFIFLAVSASSEILAAADTIVNATFSAQVTSSQLWIACQPSNTSDIDTLYYIIMSKLGSTTFNETVTLRDDNKIEWKNTDLQNRASVNGSMLKPVKDAILNIIIDNVNVLCADSGVYSCIISGLGFGYKPFKQTATLEVNACPHATSGARNDNCSKSYFIQVLLFIFCYNVIIQET